MKNRPYPLCSGYIYYGDIDFTAEEILNIIIIASDFNLNELVQHSKEYFYDNRKEILQNGNFLDCAQEYLNKVMPYERLLPKEIKKEILRTYIFNKSDQILKSRLINERWNLWIGSTNKIGRIIDSENAIRWFKGWGPIFGDLNGYSNDLVMTSLDIGSSSSGSYKDIGIPNQFKVQE
ncbi:hypothetical protein GLOIN_2v1472656 [Rhizophagus clarus]|uniref:Uncharacterized protein n=1 Tax=Rhizophagus clarus TaxID=94130 RepID=A0A8H3QPI8_9GLOM|nr:hypothetical protein GLOIN_2v1472656 [Rhizophagus clarus]